MQNTSAPGAGHRVVSREQWLKERISLLSEEKALMRQRDEMSRRVREGGFSAQADFPSNWCTRERIRSILSAMINRVVRASPSGVSVEGQHGSLYPT